MPILYMLIVFSSLVQAINFMDDYKQWGLKSNATAIECAVRVEYGRMPHLGCKTIPKEAAS